MHGEFWSFEILVSAIQRSPEFLQRHSSLHDATVKIGMKSR